MQKNTSLRRHVMWAITLALGFGTAWPIVIAWLGSSSTNYSGKQIVIQADGTPLVQEYEDDDYSSPVYRDLEGGVVTISPRASFAYPVSLTAGIPGNTVGSSLDWSTRLKAFSDNPRTKIIWYLVHDGRPDGTAYFVGFHMKSRACVGYIGQAGLSTQLPSKDQTFAIRSDLMNYANSWSTRRAGFEIGGVSFGNQIADSDHFSHLVFVPSGNSILAIDLQERTVAQVMETPDRILSVVVSMVPVEEDRAGIRNIVLIRTNQKIYTLNADTKLSRTFTIPPEMDPKVDLSWYELLDGKAVIVVSRKSPDGRRTPIDLYTISPDGTIESKREFILDSGVDPKNPKAEMFAMCWLAPVPAVLAMSGLVIAPLIESYWGLSTNYSEAALRYLRDGWPGFLSILIVSSLLATWGRRRATAFALSDGEKQVWTIFIALLGVPGFVGFLLHRHWPVRQKCPSCPVNVPRDREACAACGIPFPEPALKGTEIFA